MRSLRLDTEKVELVRLVFSIGVTVFVSVARAWRSDTAWLVGMVNPGGQVHILEMTELIHINVLLAVCTALVGFGILTAISPGFFMNLLGAGMMGTGGAAAYLIWSHRFEPQ